MILEHVQRVKKAFLFVFLHTLFSLVGIITRLNARNLAPDFLFLFLFLNLLRLFSLRGRLNFIPKHHRSCHQSDKAPVGPAPVTLRMTGCCNNRIDLWQLLHTETWDTARWSLITRRVRNFDEDSPWQGPCAMITCGSSRKWSAAMRKAPLSTGLGRQLPWPWRGPGFKQSATA